MALLGLDRLSPGGVDLLRAVLAEAADASPALVGGAVRDALVRRRGGAVPAVRRDSASRRRPAGGDASAPRARRVDLDVAVRGDAIGIARRVAERTGGTFVLLDAERGAARVVAGDAWIDITDWRAATLDEDLAARDFTVNALAVPLASLLARGRATVLDPTGGIDDLRAQTLRLPGPRVLLDDPLRALRGARFEAELGFTLTSGAVRAIRAAAPALARVAPERIRDELAVLLGSPETGRAVRRLDALGLLTVILPEIEPMRRTRQPRPHRFSVLEHSFRALDGADRLLARLDELAPFGDDLVRHVREPVGGGLGRAQVLKLAALLHDVSKPETRRAVDGRIRFFEHDVIGAAKVRAIGERLRLPERATSLLEALVRQHLRPMHLGQAGVITRRARYRFFRDLGDDARDLLLLTLVDAAAVTGISPLQVWCGARVVRDLFDGVEEVETTASTPPLLRGGDVMTHFGLDPGPEVGRLLGLAREAQDLGLVQTRDDALAFLDSRGRDSYSSDHS